MWADYMSIKVGRLLLPFLLLTTLGASPWLAAPANWVALGAQTAFYLLAAIDPLWPERAPGKTIPSSIRAFVVMMLAAVFAVAVFFVKPTSLWKETQVRTSGHA